MSSSQVLVRPHSHRAQSWATEAKMHQGPHLHAEGGRAELPDLARQQVNLHQGLCEPPDKGGCMLLTGAANVSTLL